MATLSGKAARVKITAAAATSSTGEASTRSTGLGSTGRGYIAVNSTAKRHFNRNNSTAFKLYLNTVSQGSSLWTLNPVLGRFVYNSTTDPAVGTWTADIEYVTSSYLGEAQSWNVDANTEMLDITAFSTSATNTQWRTFIPGLSQATVNITRNAIVNSTERPFFDRLAASQDVIVELWADVATRNKLEGYARVDGDSFTDPIDGTLSETVSLTIDGTLYNSTV